MSDEEIARRNNRGRRLWDNHGSWLLLAIIGVACFMAGSQFASYQANETLAMVIKSHERQDGKRVERIRELINLNNTLTIQVGGKVEVAAERATEAADRATEAADKVQSMEGQRPQ